MKRAGTRIHEEFFLIHGIMTGLLVTACILGGWYLGGISKWLLHIGVFLLLFLWMFLSVNVMLGKEQLSVYFNAPLFKREFPYSSIAECRVVSGKWWRQPRVAFPLGISFSKRALLIEFKDGRRPVLIGSRYAERLCSEINARLRA